MAAAPSGSRKERGHGGAHAGLLGRDAASRCVRSREKSPAQGGDCSAGGEVAGDPVAAGGQVRVREKGILREEDRRKFVLGNDEGRWRGAQRLPGPPPAFGGKTFLRNRPRCSAGSSRVQVVLRLLAAEG